jgi:TetR/AcrR family transcriptional regulator, tetracycline repressor protein
MATSKLDRRTVVDAAMALLDEVGLEGLSLRRLARSLDVQAPALYRHFADKEDLLGAMADSMFDDELAALDRPAPGADWAEWLVCRSRALRRAMLAHRDGGRLKEHMRNPTTHWPGMELLLQLMSEASFSNDEAMYAISALGHHVLGSVIAEQEAQRYQGPRDTGAQIDARRFPRLARGAALRAEDRDFGSEFEYGLAVFVTGLRASRSACVRSARADRSLRA